MMKILITGVAGFIGSHLAHEALQKGHAVVGVDDFSQGKLKNIPKGIEFIECDLASPFIFNKLPEHCDAILHMAGQSSGEISFDDPSKDLEKNVASTLNLIKYGVEKKVKKLIYASSMSVYGNQKDQPVSENAFCQPLSCYGIGKLAAEHYLKVYQTQLPFVAFRMFNVYGPGQDLANLRQGMVSIYLAYALKQSVIPVKGSLDRFRDFVFIDDVIKIWLKALEEPKFDNRIFNLGTGIKTSVRELLSTIKTFLPHVSWNCVEGTPGDQFGIYAGIQELNNTLGSFLFTPLNHGIEQFINWARSEGQ